jgi:hypothetical protein
MAHLVVIVRATRKSARAMDRMQRAYREWQEYKSDAAWRRYLRAASDYHSAQRELASNPLPGDAQ